MHAIFFALKKRSLKGIKKESRMVEKCYKTFGILKKNIIAKHDGEDEFPDATPQKVSVCLLITDNLKRPILVKTKYHILAYKLYFGIFANGFFKYTGYSKFTRNLCPLTHISNINTLHLDV